MMAVIKYLFIVFMVIMFSEISKASDSFPHMKIIEYIRTGQLMLAKKMLEESEGSYSDKKQYYPFFSDYDAIPKHQPTLNQTTETLNNNLNYEVFDAIDEIIKIAKDRQIVILNEAHHRPRHRAFGLLLAKALREIGYEYMAMEAFNSNLKLGIFELNQLRPQHGFYTSAPIFGDFVRHTNNLGYKMVSYEGTTAQRSLNQKKDRLSRTNHREKMQALNLMNHVFKKDPKAKIFIYVGYSHAMENWKTHSNGTIEAWMAARLKKATGLDPLTIDQAFGTEGTYVNNKPNDLIYNIVEKEYDLKSPSILKKNGNYLISKKYNKRIDLTVFHPKQTIINGRPKWLKMNGYRTPYKIINKEFFSNKNILLQAFLKSEKLPAIPVDQISINSDQGSSTFLLPKGSYNLISRDEDNTIKHHVSISFTNGKWEIIE